MTMIEGDLNTTNILLGFMAAVSVLQALVFIGVGVMAFRLYRRIFRTIRDIEQRQIAPLAAQVAALGVKVDLILGDLREVTVRLTRQAERVDAAIHQTVDRVDETAGRVLDSVESRITRIAGLVRGVTCAIQDLFKGRRSGETPAA